MKKFKIVLVTILVMAGLVALFSAIDRSDTRAASSSIESLQHNRLVAANYIYHASDLMHNKRILVERLEQVNSVTLAEENLNLTPKLKAVLSRYEKISLTREEQAVLASLNKLVDEMERIEGEQLYSYQVRDRMRLLTAESLAQLRTLSDIQLKEGAVAASAGQTAVSGGLISEELITALFVVGMIGLIFVFTGVSRRTSGIGRPSVKYLNSLMM